MPNVFVLLMGAPMESEVVRSQSSHGAAPTKPNVTAELVRAVFRYCPDTGQFFYRKSRPHRSSDVPAGRINKKGYRILSICGFKFQAHRLAWLHVYGSFPVGEIDHKNGARDDNRIANLRDVTTIQNQWNRTRARTGSTSGLIGAHLMHSGNWAARIVRYGKQKHLGTFATAEAAHAAYVAARLAEGNPMQVSE